MLFFIVIYHFIFPLGFFITWLTPVSEIFEIKFLATILNKLLKRLEHLAVHMLQD